MLLVTAAMILMLGFSPTCEAQERTTLRKVEIVGLQRLPSDQVLAASGLKVGDLVDRTTIDAAAEKLMRSGWFMSVDYRVSTADSDTTVIFDVVEKATPAGSSSGETLGQVVWSGNNALSNQELSTAFGLRPGDPAPRAKVDQGLDAVRKAYARRGYINAQIAEAVTRDPVNRRVNYQFTIREGQQYRMGVLTITGLGPADTRSLRSKWTLAANTVFDDSYLEQFRTTAIRPFVANLTQRTGVRSKFEVNTRPDIQKQTIDVIIAFK